VALTEDDDVVQHLAAEGAHEPLGVTVLPRRPRRCLDLPDAQAVDTPSETPRSATVAVLGGTPRSPVRRRDSVRSEKRPGRPSQVSAETDRRELLVGSAAAHRSTSDHLVFAHRHSDSSDSDCPVSRGGYTSPRRGIHRNFQATLRPTPFDAPYKLLGNPGEDGVPRSRQLQ